MGDDAQRTEKIARINALNSFTTFFLSWPRLFTKKKDSSCIRHAAAASISLALMFVSLSL